MDILYRGGAAVIPIRKNGHFGWTIVLPPVSATKYFGQQGAWAEQTGSRDLAIMYKVGSKLEYAT